MAVYMIYPQSDSVECMRVLSSAISIDNGRNLSPVLRRELENLDKDAECRKSAMKALNSYVKELDSKAIPHFLVQISEKKETGISSREHIYHCTKFLLVSMARKLSLTLIASWLPSSRT
ncbi:unnamed protein product [Ilex paraguariensis]|uniref:Uncharacterized protein n=1 Tax=Ilex paraguariensis TaxID=185542 RepID=A0ABC8SFH1_9AQUA